MTVEQGDREAREDTEVSNEIDDEDSEADDGWSTWTSDDKRELGFVDGL